MVTANRASKIVDVGDWQYTKQTLKAPQQVQTMIFCQITLMKY
jgi:hypothetical protein